MNRNQRVRFVALAAIAGLMAVALVAPRSQVGTYLLPFAAFFALILPVHELGHALAGALVGHRIVLIRLGVGPELLAFEAWGVTVQINAVPVSGLTVGLPGPARWGARLRQWIFAAGGLLANVGLYVVMRRLLGAALDDSEHHPFLAMASSANWTVMVLNAIPFRMAEGTMSDGYQLLTIPFWPRARIQGVQIAGETRLVMLAAERGELQGARERAEDLRRRFPRHASSAIIYGQMLHVLRRHEEARAIWREGLAEATEPHATALLKNNIAWIDVLLGDADLAEADLFSAEAVVALPDSVPVGGTRGSVLVRLGRGAEALPYLERSYAAANGAGRACTRAFMARAFALSGRPGEARRALDEARALDPTCELLPWIEAALDHGPSPGLAAAAPPLPEPSAATAAATRAAAGAALLPVWRRDTRIVAFAAMLVLPQRLGMPFMFPTLLAIFVSIMPEPSGVMAFGIACAWAAVVLASGQLHLGHGLEPPPAGAVLVGLAFAAAFFWLHRRAGRAPPQPPTRGPLVLGILLMGVLALSMLALVMAFLFQEKSALAIHERLEGIAEESLGLVALGGLWAVSPKRWLRAAAAVPFGLALVASVGASDWYFERYVVGDVPLDGPPITWRQPQPATVLRSRTFAANGGRWVVSPGGKTFAAVEVHGAEGEKSTIHVGDFGTRLVDIEAVAFVFLDDDRMLLARPKPGGTATELVEVRPFASQEPAWTKVVPRLDPTFLELALDARTETVVVRGFDRVDDSAVVWRTAASADAPFEPVPTPARHDVPQAEYYVPVMRYLGPEGAGELIIRRPRSLAVPRRFAPWRPRFAASGVLWLRGPERDTLLSSTFADLSCASPFPGDSAIWCLPGGPVLYPVLLRVDSRRNVLERVPGRIPFARAVSAPDPSHLALLSYDELRVIDLRSRQGAALILPESKDAGPSSLVDGALAVFHRGAARGAASITVYARPAETPAP